jgi:type IV secretory pathway protease TraF
LGLAVVFWGTSTGSICLGLAFSAHASSAIDVLFQYPGHIRSRLVIAGVVMAALGLGLYIPATRAFNVFAEPITITATSSPFAEGDVVLTNRWAYRGSSPQPGDVVLVQLPGIATGDGHHTAGLVIREGQFIDRILAGPGSEVAIESGRLSINGDACSLEPLGKSKMPALLRFTLAANQYLILPSTLAVVNERLATPAHWETLFKVPRERILGRVYLRHQPLSRWWWIG